MSYTIYHNPRCSKSRQGLKILEAAGIEPNIHLYLEDVLSADDIREILLMLGLDDPRDLMRKGEDIYKALDLKNIDSETALITAMAAHPKLIERPIVVKDDTAVIGRPPENIRKLL